MRLPEKSDGNCARLCAHVRALGLRFVLSLVIILTLGVRAEAQTPPSITVQPTNQTVAVGGSAAFSVTAEGGGLTYQWVKDGVILPGANSATLTVPSVQPVHIGFYSLVVTNTSGSVTSSVVSLAIPGIPTGLWQELMAYYPLDGNANDTGAGGNHGTINAATSAANRFGVASSAFSFNGTSSVISAPNRDYLRFGTNDFTISIWASDEGSGAEVQPLGLDNGPGSNAKWLFVFGFTPSNLPNPAPARYISFHTSDGIGPSYWLAHDRFDPGLSTWHQYVFTRSGTNFSLFIDGVRRGSTNHLTTPPANLLTSDVAGPTTISTAITAPLTIGWAEGGGYFKGKLDDVRIYNRALSTNEVTQLFASESAVPPVIAMQPANQTYLLGGNALFSVTAVGTDSLAYQWRSNGVALPDATNTTLTLTNIPSAASGSQFSVVVTNTYGSVTSSVAVLTMLSPPVITSQPQSTTNFSGRVAFFSVTATGSAPLAYQWRKDGTNLIGATNALLLLGNVQTNQAGSYSVVVSNGAGAVTSSNATLTVIPAPGGRVVAWDENTQGQTNVPTVAQSGVVSVSAGGFHSLALKSDGTVSAWGWDTSGQSTVPINLSGVVAVSAGAEHSMALKSDGTVVAWGKNGDGQSTVPAGLTGVVAVAAGNYHSLALKSDGTVVAWGFNSVGAATVPAGLGGVVAVSGGGNHSLALKSDGTVVSWGQNDSVPLGLSGVKSVATTGGSQNLAVLGDGTVRAWGFNNFGQTNVPADLAGVREVAGGNYHNLALKTDGTVMAWSGGFDGNNFGQTNVPPGLTGVVTVSARRHHNLAVTTNAPLPILILVDGIYVPNGSVARGAQASVTLLTSFTNATIYYSTDGTAPFIGGPLTYSGAFTVTTNTTVRALAVNLDDFSSVPSDPVSITIIPTYALTLTTAGGGTVAKSPSASSYLSNSVVTVTATPDAGWTFLGWTGSTNGFTGGTASSAGATNAITMNRARSVQAVFGTTLSTSVAGSGTVQPSPASGPYPYGSVVRLTPKPAVGHYFAL